MSPKKPWVNLFVPMIERFVLEGFRALRRAAVRKTMKIEDLKELKARSQSSPLRRKKCGGYDVLITNGTVGSYSLTGP